MNITRSKVLSLLEMRFFWAFTCGYKQQSCSIFSKVKQFLRLLVLPQAVSQIIAQPGLSTIDNKQPTMPRQVPRECHSILQHLRYNKFANVLKTLIMFSACLLFCLFGIMFVFFLFLSGKV